MGSCHWCLQPSPYLLYHDDYGTVYLCPDCEPKAFPDGAVWRKMTAGTYCLSCQTLFRDLEPNEFRFFCKGTDCKTRHYFATMKAGETFTRQREAHIRTVIRAGFTVKKRARFEDE